MRSTFRSFQGANFTGNVGEQLTFVVLDANGKPLGDVIEGTITAVYRMGRTVVVNIRPRRKDTYDTYLAKRIYYKGRWAPLAEKEE